MTNNDDRLSVIATVFFLLIFAGLVAFYWPWFSGQGSFFYEDTSNAYEPLYSLFGCSLARMHVPLWDSYNYCGMSLSALPLLYPPNVIFAWLPYNQGAAGILILSELVAFSGTYLLIRAAGWGTVPALLGGLTVGCSGYMFSFANNMTLAATASWLPLCLFCIKKSWQTPLPGAGAMKWCLLLALCTALMVSAGRPEIGGVGLMMLAAFAGVLYHSSNQSDRGRYATLQMKGMAMGLLFAMPVIVPAFEWLPWSRRAGGLTPREVLLFSANWYDLINLFAAQPLGDLQINYSGMRALVQPNNYPPYFQSAFVGPIAIGLSILGLQRRGKLLYFGTIVLLIGSLLLALGQNVPFMPWLVANIPGFSAVRFPSKLMIFVVMCIALFAARGMKNYLAGSIKLKLIPYAVLCAVVAAGGALLAFSPVVLLPFYTGVAAQQLAAQQAIGTSLLVWDAVAVFGVLVLFAGNRFARRGHAAVVVTAVAALSLFANAWINCRAFAPVEFFAQPSLAADKIKQLEPDPAQRANTRSMLLSLENLSVPPALGNEDALAHAVRVYSYQRQLLKPYGNVDYRLASPWGFDGPTSGEYSNLMLNLYIKSSQSLPLPGEEETHGERADEPLYRLLQTTATKYAITQSYRYVRAADNRGNMSLAPVPVPVLSPRFFQVIWETGVANLRIYQLKEPLPRAYLSYSWSALPRDEIVDLIAEAPKGQFNPEKLTLIESGVTGLPEHAQSTLPAAPVAIDQVEAEDIRLQVKTQTPCLLVLCDQYYPGWNAYLDNRAVPILRANGFMRAVALPPGNHVVRFRFQPASLLIGCILAVLGLLWAVLLIRQTVPRSKASAD